MAVHQMIGIIYDGKEWWADTVEEAVELICLLKRREEKRQSKIPLFARNDSAGGKR
jgi:hypothetical protein